MRVMIVEDEPILAFELDALVEEAGFESAGWAWDAASAIALAAERRPDLVLVDLRLKDGLTGPEIARVLASDLGLRLLFVTGDSSLIPVGLPNVVGVLAKPIEAPRLREALAYADGLASGRADIPLPAGLRPSPRAI